MKFVYPEFLYALFALAIPILIHLFNFRRYKTIYFTNVRFLKSVQEETQSSNKLKHLLVLLSRILALVALILAFAQPTLFSNNQQQQLGDHVVGIYLDNSFSMQTEGANGQLLDVAKNKALNVIDAYQHNDQFLILTNDFESKHQRLMNKEQLIEELQTIQFSPAVKTLAEATSRLNDIMAKNKEMNRSIYLISDYQRSSAELSKLNADSLTAINFVPLSPELIANLYIDSCWFYTPFRQQSGPEKLIVKIVNASEKEYENIPIRLEINDQTKTPGSFNIGPNDVAYDTLSFTNGYSGLQAGKISIKDYPTTFDDHFYFSYIISENTNVSVIDQSISTPPVEALFKNDDYINLQQFSVENINYQTLAEQQLIIINNVEQYSSGLIQELKKFVTNGGNLLLFPHKEDTKAQNELINVFGWQLGNRLTTPAKIDFINASSPVFQNVFEKLPENLNLPVAAGYYQLPSNGEVLMRFQNRKPFLIRKTMGKGTFYLAATSLETDESNFTEHAIFVPTVYNIALNSQMKEELFYTINENNKITTAGYYDKQQPINIVGNQVDFIPEQRKNNQEVNFFLHGQIKEAGNYTLVNQGEIISSFGMNYDRRESELSSYTVEELTDELRRSNVKNYTIFTSNNEFLTNEIRQFNDGIALWKYAIVLCLFFLGCEVLLLRFYQ